MKIADVNIERFINKWYLSIIIIPIIINYLTNWITLPDLFSNWMITIIFTMAIIILLLIFKLYEKNHSQFSFEKDTEIVTNLLNILDVDLFQKEVYYQSSENGYLRDAVFKILHFHDEAKLISNRTTDKKLNRLIIELNNSLEEFTDFSKNELYGDHTDYLRPAYENEISRARAEKATPTMNKLTKEAFIKLDKLLMYCKNRSYL